MNAKTKETTVVIIGAGPAGSTCANLLKEAGVACVLVDFQQFPREKVCGGGLTPKAWHLLDNLMPDLNYNYLPDDHFAILGAMFQKYLAGTLSADGWGIRAGCLLTF